MMCASKVVVSLITNRHVSSCACKNVSSEKIALKDRLSDVDEAGNLQMWLIKRREPLVDWVLLRRPKEKKHKAARGAMDIESLSLEGPEVQAEVPAL